MKICKDCKFCDYNKRSWFSRTFGFDTVGKFSKCLHPRAEKSWDFTDEVSGERTIGKEHSFCSTMRMFDSSCGRQANFFEPKE